MRILFILSAFFCTQIGFAQSNGKVTYEDKIDLHRDLPPDREDFKDMIPQYNTSKWELTYSGDKSIYQLFKETELTGTNANQSGYRMRFGRENRTVYKDIADDVLIDSRDFMQKQFLIKGFTTTTKWKIGKKQKEIMGYHCLEASHRVDSATMVTAWFTPQIATSTGPLDYHGLPGLILQIDINDGQRTITSTEIKLDSVDTSIIIAPTKGKEITQEEFEKLREEKMKEMNLQKSSQGPMIMTRRN